MHDIAQLLKEYGHIGTLVVLLLFIWKAGRWCGSRVIEPVTKRHLEFVDSLDKRDAQAVEQLRGIKSDLFALRNTQEEIKQVQAQHFAICSDATKPAAG